MEVSRKQNASSPCAACKLLRRRCSRDCVFAPYFPAEEPGKFAGVHKVFGASNVSKMLQELAEEHRGDAVSSMVYEANARMRDPVYGCVGAISYLQQQIDGLRQQLALTQAEMLYLRVQQATSDQATSPNYSGSQLSYTFMSHSKPSSYDMEAGAVEHSTFRESMWSST
ncbi:LOB domain-containing protein 4-like [Salvia splendens]|uniref:LOB domain-containing protein 4-like n=1 Tax=Salvia splendens TaxID=180675 RepID=UPI001103E468|nr:LOB domain-containing protein 4-like [Salvia splendens]